VLFAIGDQRESHVKIAKWALPVYRKVRYAAHNRAMQSATGCCRSRYPCAFCEDGEPILRYQSRAWDTKGP